MSRAQSAMSYARVRDYTPGVINVGLSNYESKNRHSRFGFEHGTSRPFITYNYGLNMVSEVVFNHGYLQESVSSSRQSNPY